MPKLGRKECWRKLTRCKTRNADGGVLRGWATAVVKAVAKISEGVAAGLLAAIFVTFLVQIFSRYALESPFGWTLELCLTLWVWLVFFGGGFVVRHRDHVKFDMLYNAVAARWRRGFALVGAGAIVAAMAVAFVPTWDFIDFLKIKRSATLGVQMRAVFAVYALFMVAVAAVYAVRFVTIWRRGVEDGG